MPQLNFTLLDMDKILAMANRLVSVQTVADIQEFRVKVQEAAEIATEAALRILGVTTRALLPDDQAAIVSEIVLRYQQQDTPEARD